MELHNKFLFLRLLPQADHQGNSVFLFTKGILHKIMHKINRHFKLELEWGVFSYKLPLKSKKVIQKKKNVARNPKSCSKD